MKIIPIPCLHDNYQYLVVDSATGKAAVVDPINIDEIFSIAKGENAQITHALITHWHPDHASSTRELADKTKGSGLKIVAGEEERIEAVDLVVGHDAYFQVGSLHVKALSTPPHAWSHICFYVWDEASGEKAVFTGDCLFSGGAGFIKEGPTYQLHQSLNHTLASLPDDTLVYVGHEYTVSNLTFALTVEPENAAITRRLAWAEGRRAAGEPTVPSTIGGEKEFNLFMRVGHQSLQARLGVRTPVEALVRLRRLKNAWNETSAVYTRRCAMCGNERDSFPGAWGKNTGPAVVGEVAVDAFRAIHDKD